MRRRSIVLAVFVLPAFFVVAILSVFRERILLTVGDFLVIQDELEPVDVIHVFAGDEYRTNYAIRLYKQGYAKYIYFTGGLCPDHGWNHGTHGKEIAISQGVPPEAIAFDDSSSQHTYPETLSLQTWLGKSPDPIRSVIVVSDPYNMRRYRWLHRWVLGNKIEILMAPVPFEQTPYKQLWWKDKASRKLVEDEYIKSVYYLFRFKLSRGPLSKWLASFEKD